MKNAFKILALCSAAVALSSTASALYWEDYDSIVVKLGEGQSYHGEFRIVAPVDTYNPAIHTVTSARVGFAFADDASDVGEYVDIWIDASKIWNDLEVNGTHPAINFAWSWKWLSGSLLTQLQDGVLNYTVKIQNTPNGYGDTWLKAAHLKAWGELKQVPDSGSTLALFGLGLLGLVAARTRFAK